VFIFYAITLWVPNMRFGGKPNYTASLALPLVSCDCRGAGGIGVDVGAGGGAVDVGSDGGGLDMGAGSDGVDVEYGGAIRAGGPCVATFLAVVEPACRGWVHMNPMDLY
jgi:hypothetical protein